MPKLLFVSLFFLLFLPGRTFLYAQTPFRLHSPEDYITGGGLIGFTIGSNLVYRNKSSLSEEEIARVNIYSVNKFDRSAAYQYSVQAAHWSDGLLVAGILAPATLYCGSEFRKGSLTVSVMALETILLTAAEIQLVKGLVKRKRPFVYNSSAPVSEKRKADATASFFSGHTALTATATMYTATVYTLTHPNRSRDPWIWAGAAAIPAATGFLRYKAGKHFPSDIIAGFLVGTLNGILIPQLHKR